MSPQKPVGNGYYGYEDLPNGDSAPTENRDAEAHINTAQNEQNSSTADNDFSEYLWMENEEEFDKQVLQQLEEEELMEQCLEAMLEDEHNHAVAEERMLTNQVQNREAPENQDSMNIVNNFKLNLVDVEKSTLNPLAAEFIPDSKALIWPDSTKKE